MARKCGSRPASDLDESVRSGRHCCVPRLLELGHLLLRLELPPSSGSAEILPHCHSSGREEAASLRHPFLPVAGHRNGAVARQGVRRCHGLHSAGEPYPQPASGRPIFCRIPVTILWRAINLGEKRRGDRYSEVVQRDKGVWIYSARHWRQGRIRPYLGRRKSRLKRSE